jgi:DeoR/GlpR family transcriptional regulator of sugar metabolism
LGKEHRLAQRRRQILAALEQAGELSVVELSRRFDVSEVTIRQDLQALSEQGLVLRTRGRALSTNVLPEFSFDIRQQQQAAEKARIGQAAVALINYGDTIFLDASTTAQAIIPHLKKFSELTVITNSLKAALSLLDMPHVHVILPGGSLRRTSISLIGQAGCDLIDNINFQLGFFGARGLSLSDGLTDAGVEEAKMKQSMVKRCQRVVGLVDARKWDKVAAVTFAHLDQVDTVISDTNAPEALVGQVRDQQIEVILV